MREIRSKNIVPFTSHFLYNLSKPWPKIVAKKGLREPNIDLECEVGHAKFAWEAQNGVAANEAERKRGKSFIHRE